MMKQLGDIALGRPNLGDKMPVFVYRLMEMALKDVLEEDYGTEVAEDLFRRAGHLSGLEFAKKNLNTSLDFNDFVQELQTALIDNKIGILKIEHADLEKAELILCIYEDLDCSGLPVYGETVCVYDEGFIAGILEFYSGVKFKVRELDCWATGQRVCRFVARGTK